MVLKKPKAVFYIVIFSVLLLVSCKPKTKVLRNTSPDEILKADKTFSETSRKKGMKNAFIEYIDNEGILLRPNHLPIIGADAIDFLSQINDSSYTLTWSPRGGELAASGELGYTYGIYTLEMKDSVFSGNYVSIWKKQKDGKWKFVLDSGNPGTGKSVSNQ